MRADSRAPACGCVLVVSPAPARARPCASVRGGRAPPLTTTHICVHCTRGRPEAEARGLFAHDCPVGAAPSPALRALPENGHAPATVSRARTAPSHTVRALHRHRLAAVLRVLLDVRAQPHVATVSCVWHHVRGRPTGAGMRVHPRGQWGRLGGGAAGRQDARAAGRRALGRCGAASGVRGGVGTTAAHLFSRANASIIVPNTNTNV